MSFPVLPRDNIISCHYVTSVGKVEVHKKECEIDYAIVNLIKFIMAFVAVINLMNIVYVFTRTIGNVTSLDALLDTFLKMYKPK